MARASKRLILLLTDNVPVSIGRDLDESDIVLLGHGVRFEHPSADVRPVGLPGIELQWQLACEVAKAFDGPEWGNLRAEMLSVANDLYSYVLRPLLAVVEAAASLLMAYPEAELIVVHARRVSHRIPLIGIATSESPRGSRSLLGAYIAFQLKQIAFIARRARFVETRGGWLCSELMRACVIATMNTLMGVGFLGRLALLRYKRDRQLVVNRSGGVVVLVRAFHQMRFARRIVMAVEEDSRPAILFLPQFTQAFTAGVRRAIRFEMKGLSRVSPCIRQLWVATLQARRDKQALKGIQGLTVDLRLKVAGRDVRLQLEGLALELSRLSVSLLYRRLLTTILGEHSIRRLVNFELVGGIAGFDRLAADNAGCEIVTVQSAVISEVPHPVFPVANEFYADGPQAARKLSGIGALKQGEVKYGGSGIPVSSLHEPRAPKVMAFFTQPYEVEISRSILVTLLGYCKQTGCRLIVKLHPRDSGSAYSSILADNSACVEIHDSGGSPVEVILESDLCITRTSSVAKEALAYGRPIILCLWSEFDKSVKADYTEQLGGDDHRTQGPSELLDALRRPEALTAAARGLRERLFAGKGVNELAALVCMPQS